MTSKIKIFGEMIYDWLSQFATVYRGVLPSGYNTDDLYLQMSGYYDTLATQFILPVQIYKRNTTSYSSILQIAQDIENAIDYGVLLVNNNITVKIEKGSPFYQDKADEKETIRAGYINLLVTIY